MKNRLKIAFAEEQEGLVVGIQRGHVIIGLDNPIEGLAFRDVEAVAAGHQDPGQDAGKNAQLEVRHIGRFRDEPILIGLAVEHHQMAFFPRAMQALSSRPLFKPIYSRSASDAIFATS